MYEAKYDYRVMGHSLQSHVKIGHINNPDSILSSFNDFLQCGRPGFDPWVGKFPLEKEMATHSSTLAWKILWTEKPGGLQSMGSQRVGHN